MPANSAARKFRKITETSPPEHRARKTRSPPSTILTAAAPKAAPSPPEPDAPAAGRALEAAGRRRRAQFHVRRRSPLEPGPAPGIISPARRNPTRPRRGESSRRRGVGAARSSAAEGEACLSTGPTPRRPQKKARRPKRRFSDPSSSSPQSPQRKAASPRTRCRSPDRTRCGERAPPEWPARRQSPPTGEWGTWRWPRC